MKQILHVLLGLFSISVLVASCVSTGPLTIVDAPATTITSNNQVSPRARADMKVLKYGELDQIKSLDPLTP